MFHLTISTFSLSFSKWIGPLDQWNALFEDISKKGYNMIHFTPLQERGVSNSPYSIYDQLRFDPNLFKSNDDAAKFLKELLAKNNLLSLTDVVLNHTANNSEWIREYPMQVTTWKTLHICNLLSS